jgi:hypothetical protein
MKKLLLFSLLLISMGVFAVDDFAGNCLDFDGTDDYVEIAAGSSSLSGNFTVEVWAKPMHGTNVIHILGSRGPNEYSFDMKFENGNLIHGDIGNGTAWLTTAADASSNYSVNTWYHITYVVTTTGYQIYIDGNLEGSGNYSGTPLLFDTNHKIVIGGAGQLHNNYMQGQIDEVRVWSDARTQTEIQDNMDSTLNGTEAGLVSYWQFNESSSTTASDAVGTNTGTLNNMTNDDWIISTIPIYPFAGNGTSGDPYQISDLSELRELSESSSLWDKHFIQTADIDASATSSWNGGEGFSPIGNGTTMFTGSYDGDEFEIDGLFINRTSTGKIGLFG